MADWLIEREKSLQILDRAQISYLIFLLLIFISALFVIMRWSNITLSSLTLFKDTPVAPTGERFSFGIIFLVVYICLFNLSYLYYLYLKRFSDKKNIILAFLTGHSISIIYSYFQNFFKFELFLSRKYNGFASDSSSFGFLSSVSLLLSWYIFYKYKKKTWSAVFFIISLLGIFNSFIKVAAFALVFTILFYIFSIKKYSKQFIIFIVILGILLTSILFLNPKLTYKFRFVREIKESVISIKKILTTKEADEKSIRKIVAGRYLVWNYAYENFKKFPLSGVGAGNFVFWVKYNWFGKQYYHHLPHNQYLVFSSSIGFI
ncbi:MAG: O-antigen ligase family protein, partial [Promethearchaeia archaeon]